MGRKYEHHQAGEAGTKGWSRWISPIHGHAKRNYRMACCDCGLVHEMQFRVKKDVRGRLSIVFRASRNNRATAAMRANDLRTEQKRKKDAAKEAANSSRRAKAATA